MVSIPPSVAVRLANASNELRTPPAKTDLAFMARQFVLATLPHSDPAPKPVWRRQNGRFTLTVYPCVDPNNQPLHPYGSIPRLLLFWIVGEAARTKSRRLELGATLADFMRDVGLNPATGGGKRGDAKRLRDQMDRLFRARITFEDTSAAPNGSRWAGMPIADVTQVWWSRCPSQPALFGSFVVLGEAFFDAITTKPVPVDRRALRELRASPLCLDLYAWATHRVHTSRGQGGFIPWNGLSRQIGSAYADPKNFQKAASLALRKVASVYPGLNYQCEPGGVRLLPSRTAIPRKDLWESPSIHGETVLPPKLRPRAALPTYPPKPTVKRYP